MSSNYEYTEKSCECYVVANKEGLMSAVAHDLKMKVRDFKISFQGAGGKYSNVNATFNADLNPHTYMKDGADNTKEAITEKNHTGIRNNIKNYILKYDKFPTIDFKGKNVVMDGPDAGKIEGDLTFNDKTRSITVPVKREGGRIGVNVWLDHKDWDIPQFTAGFGAIKMKNNINIFCDCPNLDVARK